MTRRPGCDRCAESDERDGLRRENAALRARLDALGEKREEWRVTGQPTGDYPPYDFTFGNCNEADQEGTPEQRARQYVELTTRAAGGWVDGPYLHRREIRTSEWRPVTPATEEQP